MSKVIMSGCDVHERSLLVKAAAGKDAPQTRTFANTRSGREAMKQWLLGLAAAAGAERIVLVYEASQYGFGLVDELARAGIEAHVLAPTRIHKSAKARRTKTDAHDAQHLFELLRAHVLAGNELPAVWIPDPQTRDDREVVRARLDVRERASAAKTRIGALLKRHDLRRPPEVGAWTGAHREWLRHLAHQRLPFGAAAHLQTLLSELDLLEGEIVRLDALVAQLSGAERYAAAVAALVAIRGVGLLTAMVFLTELGDLRRFRNRRTIAAYLGLAPASDSSGETIRHGHITRQGPGRVRKVLCQAVWSRLLHSEAVRAQRDRIAGGKAKGRKIATVALMRQLAVLMWHCALAA